METERLRSAQIQAERMLEARERAHRQRVKGLEEQVRPRFQCSLISTCLQSNTGQVLCLTGFWFDLSISDDITSICGKVFRSSVTGCCYFIIIIIIIMTSFAPISSKIKLSGATKPSD